jgi:hypothetical protein
VALGCALLLIVMAMPLSRVVGISYFLSLPHLLLWTPLVLYFCAELRSGRIPVKSTFGVWSLLLVATCIVSLVFDARDFTRWLLGERGILVMSANPAVPWFTVFFILAALACAAACIFRKPRRV